MQTLTPPSSNSIFYKFPISPIRIKLVNLGLGLSGKLNFSTKPTPIFFDLSTIENLTFVLAYEKQFTRLPRNFTSFGETRAVGGGKGESLSAWDEKPYEVLPDGKKFYFDEQDVLSFIDPPKDLIPLDPSSYNPAAYLWKKIGDIPDERRYRLLSLLKPRLISRIWEIAGTRRKDSKQINKISSSLLSDGDSATSLEFWNCRTSGGPWPISWINFFKKAIFRCKDGWTCGRIILGGPVLSGIANSYSPLYFTVRKHEEVMATEQPCDMAYEFGDGLLDLKDFPGGFPRPVKHPWPFDDHVVVYIRNVGPGVLVGQGWQEGKVLEQVPKKLRGEIIMIKDYAASEKNC